jgi:transcription elongation GreA/GreB family factor
MSTPAPAAPIHPEMQKLIDEGKLTSTAARTLSAMEPGAYCQHKSWGFGRVTAWNLPENQIRIDFATKLNHPMQLQYAGDNLRVIPPDHFLARKADDLAGVKKMAAEDPVALVSLILQHSEGQRATPAQIAALLIPDAIGGETEFKRWWDNAKKSLKKDGRFAVPAKKTDFVEMRAEAVGHTQELIGQFQSARQLKGQLAALDQIFKHIEDFKEDTASLLPVLGAAGAAAARNQRLDVFASFELLVTRDEIAVAAGLDPAAASPTLADFLRAEEGRLGDIIGKLPAAKQRFALSQLPVALGDETWSTKALSFLPQTHNARVVGEVAKLLETHGRSEEMRAFIERTIREYSISCEMLLWLCKERSDEKFASFVGPRLFGALLSALERDAFSDIKRSTKLRELLLSDRALVPELLASADPGELRAAARALLASPSLEELDKRSLMARLIKHHPELQTLLTGGAEEKPTVLIVSWSSLEKRKLEYEDLVNKKIPENSKEIGVARSYGDLRENFEFKAAKEMQSVLLRRKAELEQDLARSRGTNFENPDISQVAIGTVVKLSPVGGGASETYTILGAWDGDPERHIISYQTTLGQALMAHRTGEIIDLPNIDGSGSRRVKIESIAAYKVPTPAEEAAAE